MVLIADDHESRAGYPRSLAMQMKVKWLGNASVFELSLAVDRWIDDWWCSVRRTGLVPAELQGVASSRFRRPIY